MKLFKGLKLAAEIAMAVNGIVLKTSGLNLVSCVIVTIL